MAERVLITGAGGHIGGYLTAQLLSEGADVRAVDVKLADEWLQRFDDAENLTLDLRLREDCERAVAGMGVAYNLACDMGGMGYIDEHKALCMLSVLINTQLLDASRGAGVERFLFASSACVYAAGKQSVAELEPLREQDAYPAEPQDGYGWEKLFGERMCRHFTEDFGLETRVVRYHNVYGPHGTFEGGREKVPAAICRRVAEARLTGGGELEIWGDGEQTRSFTYIDDCIEGTLAVMRGPSSEPLNVGSAERVSINELADIVEGIAGTSLERTYDTSAPQGVRGRNSDNTLVRELTGWEPSTSLEDGLRPTYAWIEEQVAARIAA